MYIIKSFAHDCILLQIISLLGESSCSQTAPLFMLSTRLHYLIMKKRMLKANSKRLKHHLLLLNEMDTITEGNLAGIFFLCRLFYKQLVL